MAQWEHCTMSADDKRLCLHPTSRQYNISFASLSLCVFLCHFVTGVNKFDDFCLTPWLESLSEVDVDSFDCMGSFCGLFSVYFFGRPLFFGGVCWVSGTTFISDSHGLSFCCARILLLRVLLRGLEPLFFLDLADCREGG